MVRKETDRDYLGLTQQQMASLLKVSRSNWSLFELGLRNLPPTAGLRQAEMMIYMLSPEGKALNNLPDIQQEEETLKKMLKKKQKGNDYRQSKITRKIERAKEKWVQYQKATHLMYFLSKPAQMEKALAPKAVPIITELVNRNFKKYTQEVDLLQLDLELLQAEQQVFERALSKLESTGTSTGSV
ncbi:helix-turn-helix domain-containing protein [Flavobacterium phycosphaerae]|uniref:helix-turn-helix domain-containing protein n=1 Tax=Flavobacterium phycosphaerae TaxID=2697515 RepID=UPI00138A2B5E|nr:helix-turn-helix transcriptional regulator [Flavobacterium phycosphaerae]